MAEERRGLSVESESVEALTGRDVVEPTVETVWTQEEAHRRKAAPLRMYLGAAPGVGKTYAMLSEGHRRLERGTDVVVGFVATYGRKQTIAMLEGLEVLPMQLLKYRGREFEEMDVDALTERKPQVALIDELAHTNIPGAKRAKRWEDVVDTLAAGIEVITTINIQHLESLNDVISNVTGIRQQETVPDWLFELADQVELVDMSPHALRRRIAHGNVYPDATQGRARPAAVLHDGEPDGPSRARAAEGGQSGRRQPARSLDEPGIGDGCPRAGPRVRVTARATWRTP